MVRQAHPPRARQLHERVSMTNEEFFQARLSPQKNGCVLWIGAKKSHGYGVFWRGRTGLRVSAHRYSYERTHGPIPAGLGVLHKCDNTSCVNPDHLFVGTQGDNMRDMAAKGRGGAPKGMNHFSRKLDEAKVRAIRAATETLTALAAEYGVAKQTICGIKQGKYWKSVV